MSVVLPLAAVRNGLVTISARATSLLEVVDQKAPALRPFAPQGESIAELRTRMITDAAELDRRMEASARRPDLAGAFIGVKDLFATENLPTQCGAPEMPPFSYEAAESPVVGALRKAGALFSKTSTTPWATAVPCETTNPHSMDHSPGGSSAGSAAGVAAGIFDVAIGTQTHGSMIRPAAYCGCVAFKPSQGRLSTMNVFPHAFSVDQPGYFAANVDMLATVSALTLEDQS